MSEYKRFTEKRNGKNVIPLLNSVCGVDLPKWTIAKESDIRQYLSGDAVDKFAELEDKIENGLLVPRYSILRDLRYGWWCVCELDDSNLILAQCKTEEEAKRKLEELTNGQQ